MTNHVFMGLDLLLYPKIMTVMIILAELRRVKRASGAWVRFFWNSIHARNFGYDVSVRPTVQTVRVEVGRQDSL